MPDRVTSARPLSKRPIGGTGHVFVIRDHPPRKREIAAASSHYASGTEFPAEASITILHGDMELLYVVILRDATEKKRAAQRLEYLATHDSLTGLPNRMLLFDRLSHAIARAEREEKLVALLFVDLDGFKQINDSLGHAAGDELLCAVAKRIVGRVRCSDTAGRLGGDEFAVILEGLRQVDGAASIAGHFVDRLREPFRLANSIVSTSASIGITICPFGF